MKSCTVSQAKSRLGRLADEALRGRPTVIPRGGKLVILQAYEPPAPNEFDDVIREGIESEHVPLTEAVWEGIRRRGRRLEGVSIERVLDGRWDVVRIMEHGIEEPPGEEEQS